MPTFACPTWPFSRGQGSLPQLVFEDEQPSKGGKPNLELLGAYDIVFTASSVVSGQTTDGEFSLKPSSDGDEFFFEGTLKCDASHKTRNGVDFVLLAPTRFGTPPQAAQAVRLCPLDGSSSPKGWIFVVKEGAMTPNTKDGSCFAFKQGDLWIHIEWIDRNEEAIFVARRSDHTS